MKSYTRKPRRRTSASEAPMLGPGNLQRSRPSSPGTKSQASTQSKLDGLALYDDGSIEPKASDNSKLDGLALYDDGLTAQEPRLLVPARLDEALRPLVMEASPRFLDHFRFIIHAILYRRFTDSRYKNDASYVKLAHRFFHKFISKDYTSRFLKALQAWGFIESDNSWRAGHFPKGYRIAAAYREDTVERIHYKDARLKKKIVDFHKEHLFQQISTLPGYRHVETWLKELAIDKASAESHITEHYDPKAYHFQFRQEAIQALAEKRLWFVKGTRSQRAFNNLTNLPRDMRPFLSVRGQVLHQVDIRNSQPLFLHLLLRDQPSIPVQERQVMEEVLRNGTFYEALNTRGIDRDKFKQQFYRDVLFGKGSYTSPMTERFSAAYPTYAAEIARCKEGDYKRLASLLQSKEASLVFEAVERFAQRTKQNVPILTIHDSLVTTEEYLSTAREILLEVFAERYAFQPTLNMK